MIQSIKALGLETCMTLGMLTQEQARYLKSQGLDYYNHNIDTSAEYYSEVITTRSYQDRLATIHHVRNAGLQVCCGGIIGMGESLEDRISLLHTLSTMSEHPSSVPINQFVPIKGTPLAQNKKALDPFDWVKIIAVARILMPKSIIRLSAGRHTLNDEAQALCFLAGANSIFYGDQLLTSQNHQVHQDRQLFQKLNLQTLVE